MGRDRRGRHSLEEGKRTMIRALAAALAASAILACSAVGHDGVTRYVRYEHQGEVSYGVLEGETIHQLAGDLFSGRRERTGKSVPTSEARLLGITAAANGYVRF